MGSKGGLRRGGVGIAFVFADNLKEGYRYKSAGAGSWVAGFVPLVVVLVADNVKEVSFLKTELCLACRYVSLDRSNNLIASHFSALLP
jgi:hypothetical protein